MIEHLDWTPRGDGLVAEGAGTGMRYVITPGGGGSQLFCAYQDGGEVRDFGRLEDAQEYARGYEGRQRLLAARDGWLAAADRAATGPGQE